MSDRHFLANNQPDKSESGVLKLILPTALRLTNRVPYEIAPDSLLEYSVVVTKPAKDAKGFIKLQFTHDGQVFEDIFEFGYFNPKVRLKIEDNKVKVTVTNDTDSHLNGELALATPFETWSLLGFNTAARERLAPAQFP